MKKRLLLTLFAAAAGLSSAAWSADYAPLDCAKAQSAAEIAICKTYSLGQAEARMATLYAVDMSLVAMGQRGDIGDAQRQWLKTRDACGSDIGCLSKAYGDRIEELDALIHDITSRGPY
jgi:uncharacterized protein